MFMEKHSLYKGEKMITIYYRNSCLSSRKAINWLNAHHIPYQKYAIDCVSCRDLSYMLRLTENGVDDIVKSTKRCTEELHHKILQIQQMHFNEAVVYLSKNVDVLQTPLIVDHNKFLVGYHSENIRQFAPRYYRTRSIFQPQYKRHFN